MLFKEDCTPILWSDTSATSSQCRLTICQSLTKFRGVRLKKRSRLSNTRTPNLQALWEKSNKNMPRPWMELFLTNTLINKPMILFHTHLSFQKLKQITRWKTKLCFQSIKAPKSICGYTQRSLRLPLRNSPKSTKIFALTPSLSHLKS